MNLRNKFLALLLAVAMLLSLAACSGDTNTDADTVPNTTSDTTPEPSPNTSDITDIPDLNAPEDSSILPEDFVVDTAVEDLYLATADIPGDFELFTVNGQPVSARMYLYWLAYSISEMETTMNAYYGIPLDWSEEYGIAEYLMQDALSATLMYTLVPAKALELGLDLTQEQQDELDALLASSIESMGGEDAFLDSLRMVGLDQETYLDINRAPHCYDRIVEGMFSNRPTVADVKEYIEENDILKAKHILLMTVDSSTREPLEESVIAEKKATAEDILKQLQESDNLMADFDALMIEYSEDGGLVTNPDGYTFTSGEMVTEFEEATRALEYGQISGIVESPFGYHIILRLDPDSDSLRQDCLTALVYDQINIWTNEATLVFTDEYSNLDPQMFYAKFMAYQEAFAAENSEES